MAREAINSNYIIFHCVSLSNIVSCSPRLKVTEAIEIKTTHWNIAPEFGHVIIVDSKKLCEPTNRALAAFIHGFVSLKVLVVFIYRVVGQVHVELVLRKRNEGP